MKGLQKTAKHYWHLHNKEKYRSIPHAISEKQGLWSQIPERLKFLSPIFIKYKTFIYFFQNTSINISLNLLNNH